MLLVEVTISSIASDSSSCDHYVLVGDLAGLIWVPICGPLKVDSLRYTPVSCGEDVKEPIRPIFVVRYQDSGGKTRIVEVKEGEDCNKSHEILCYKVVPISEPGPSYVAVCSTIYIDGDMEL
jgi:hypothetical protein